PLHHPVHVAEMWATLDLLSGGRVDFATGRGYDRKEYRPFGADFMASAEIFEEGIDVLLKAWNSPGTWSHKGRFFDIPEMRITPQPVQKPLPFYVASFSKTSLEMAARRGLNIIYAPFAAGMVYGGLDKAVEGYREACVKADMRPGRAMCSYFVFIADDAKAEDYGRQTQMDYFNHCVLPAVVEVVHLGLAPVVLGLGVVGDEDEIAAHRASRPHVRLDAGLAVALDRLVEAAVHHPGRERRVDDVEPAARRHLEAGFGERGDIEGQRLLHRLRRDAHLRDVEEPSLVRPGPRRVPGLE